MISVSGLLCCVQLFASSFISGITPHMYSIMEITIVIILSYQYNHNESNATVAVQQ